MKPLYMATAEQPAEYPEATAETWDWILSKMDEFISDDGIGVKPPLYTLQVHSLYSNHAKSGFIRNRIIPISGCELTT